ncbi:inorganic pyrophosphatase [Rhypophila decipiens]|uniref:inorganic diphosphatase n=1 Tax=Rhypophila decipiens TaxID=261697 RepID=A0AAN6YA62_9PEZI|nr:inorganic pyrophosphatase [Rhypophila decipiens]
MAASSLDSHGLSQPSYSLRRINRPFTTEYRIYFEQQENTTKNDTDSPIVKNSVPISPFHDIPLYHDMEKGILNMVVEIPRWSQAKFEISRSKSLNPIIQDQLDGELRFVKNCFPYKGYIWNYGALPQTWEDPSHFMHDPAGSTGRTRGDNDPLDAIEISPKSIIPTGSVKTVKPLGILCLVDSGETDWKVVVIDVHNPLAEKLDDIDDVELHFPGLLDATRDWFRWYKVPDGNEPNEFAFGGRFLDANYANKIIKECSDAWERLVSGRAEKGDVSIENTTLKDTPGKLDPDEIDLPPGEDLSPAPIEPEVFDGWVFLDKDSSQLGYSRGSLLGQPASLCINLDVEK